MSSPEPTAQPRHEWTHDEVWAAMMLAPAVETCASILGRVPVRAGNLNFWMLRRALRRVGLPRPDDFLIITPDMLDAIVEAGPPRHGDGLVEVDGQLW